MEQAPITTIGAMDQANPIIAKGGQAQENNPEIGQASGDHQRAQALRVREMTFVEVKTAAFLIGEKGFDAKAFFVPMTGGIRQIQIGDQKDGFGIAFLSPGDHGYRAVAFFGKPNVGHTDQVIGLNE
jgi:hypothetical protein